MGEAEFRAPVFKWSGIHTGGVGAVTSYLVDSGAFAAAIPIAVAQQYPMPARVVRNLRVQCTVNALGTALIVEVYRNGAASGVKVIIPAGSTALFSDVVNTITFVAGDVLDLRMDSTAAGVVSATLVATFELY